MKILTGKRALVTGAASGIGRGIALALAAEGVDLWLLDIDLIGLTELANAASAHGVTIVTDHCDVSKCDDISRATKKLQASWSGLDILVNNAGVAYYGPTDRMTAEQWQWVMNINLMAPLQFTRELLPLLLAQPESHLLNICSVSGLVAGGRFAAYHTSKFGLVGYTEAMRAEFGRQGMGVTSLCPGPVQTNLYKRAISGRPEKAVPIPPDWICSSVDKVSQQAIKAIRKNRRFVLIGFVAYTLFYVKKFVPGLLDFMNQASRKKRLPKVAVAPVLLEEKRAA